MTQSNKIAIIRKKRKENLLNRQWSKADENHYKTFRQNKKALNYEVIVKKRLKLVGNRKMKDITKIVKDTSNKNKSLATFSHTNITVFSPPTSFSVYSTIKTLFHLLVNTGFWYTILWTREIHWNDISYFLILKYTILSSKY